MYDKFVLFAEELKKVESSICQAEKSYTEAMNKSFERCALAGAQIFHRLLLFLIRADVSACEHLIALYSTLFPLNKSSFWQDGWPSTLYYLSSLKVVVFA